VLRHWTRICLRRQSGGRPSEHAGESGDRLAP
jgi:hypothetical protein